MKVFCYPSPDKNTSNYLRLSGLFFLCALLAVSCEFFNNDLKSFLEEQTGTITLRQVAPQAEKVAVGTDGYVCLAAGEESFFLPIDNPLGYALTIESSMGGGISGVNVSQADADTLRVNLPPGTGAGNEGTLHLKVKTAKEGRVLYEGDIDIAFIDFDTTLKQTPPGLSVSSALDPSLILNETFNPVDYSYTIGNAPLSFTVAAAAANSAAAVIINGGIPGTGSRSQTITPPPGDSTVSIRVQAPHGAAYREYTIRVTRTFQGITITKNPAKKVYAMQPAPNTGLNTTGMVITAFTAGLGESTVEAQCTILPYDLTTPGEKAIVVSYKGSTGVFIVWVVGLTGLMVSGPGGYAPDLGFDPSTDTYNLEPAPYTATPLHISATSGITDTNGPKLTINGAGVINGIASQVPLNPPGIPTTITIEVMSDDDGTGSSISRTYSLSVSSLPAGLEFFVSSSGSDTGGDGSGNYPYQTVTKALDIVKNIGMASTATFTITISGTITADAGTSNGMVDLSGSGYPQIVLQGKGSGTDAGVIDATGKGMRVLYVAGGNKVTLKDNLTLMGGSGTTGGGVHIAGGSTFTMTGGTIQGNETSSGGGVYVYNGTFIMSGNAVIAENTASANGGGVFLRSGNNTFTMNSGSISNNTASGGGGVYVSGNSSTSFTMNGGSISNNKASNGGGVALSGGNFTMDGSAVIQNNTSLVSNGGGVFIDNGTFTMKDSAGIQDNMTVNRGGGVYVSGNGSTFNMEGGTIQGNITSSSTNTAGGGGVYVTTNSIFSKTGGTITGSNASPGPPDDLRNMTNDNSRGHAVYCLSGGKKRNTTAGPGVNLDSSTTENWE